MSAFAKLIVVLWLLVVGAICAYPPWNHIARYKEHEHVLRSRHGYFLLTDGVQGEVPSHELLGIYFEIDLPLLLARAGIATAVAGVFVVLAWRRRV